jgi:Rrf2 family protein
LFRVTARTDYAVRALVEIARVHPVAAKGREIAESNGMPYRFLAATMTQLTRAGLLESRRGSGVDGGYRLSRDPASISLAEVVGAIEGRVVDVRATQAVDGLDASSIWMSVGEGVERALAAISLAELLDRDADGAG